MAVVRKSMRATSIALHSNLVPSHLQQLPIVLSFISFQVKLCGDNVRPGKVFEVWSNYWCEDPLIVQLFLELVCQVPSVLLCR